MGVDRQPPFVATNSVVVVVHRVFQLWVFVQLTIAALHLNANEGAPQSFHVFYGVLSAVTVASVATDQMKQHQNALYGWGGLFIMGLGIRALVLL